ncbi:MAG: hypothetical protein QXI87_02975 [Thermoproteota archaeon]
MGRKLGIPCLQKKIESFLEKLEFNDVKGAKEDFEINGIKIDVCGGYENALIIVKCATREDLGNRTVINMISEIRGKCRVNKEGYCKPSGL